MNREEFVSLVRAFRWGDREWKQPSMAEVEAALDEYTREVRRTAWDEGYKAGWKNGNNYLSASSANPYRKEADR